MNNLINVMYVTDQLLENLRENAAEVGELIKSHSDTLWLKKYASGQMFEEKKFTIPDFKLHLSEDGNYDKVDYKNCITLYEALNKLPRYVLTNENFWVWLELTSCYEVCRQAMPIKSKSTFKDHWLFSGGNRRGIFFGVLSRCYFRVELTVDDSLPDKYELTKFVCEKIERFRTLTWRSISSEKHVVLGVIKAEKDLYDEYNKDAATAEMFRKAEAGKNGENLYTEFSKQLSLFGSVRLLDALSEEDIYEFSKQKMVELINRFNS